MFLKLSLIKRVRVDLPVAIPPVIPKILTFSNLRVIMRARMQGNSTAKKGKI